MSNKFDSVFKKFLTEAGGTGLQQDVVQKAVEKAVGQTTGPAQDQLRAIGSALLGDDKLANMQMVLNKDNPVGLKDYINKHPEEKEYVDKLVSDYQKTSQQPPASQQEGGTQKETQQTSPTSSGPTSSGSSTGPVGGNVVGA